MSIGGGTVRLWLLHFFGNALLLAGIYAWLSIGDANAAQVAGTAIYGLSIAFLLLWLYCGTFVYFSAEPRGRLRTAYYRALRTLLPFAVVALVAVLVYWLLSLLGDRIGDWAATTASWFTLKLRHPVKPSLVARVFTWMLWVVEWAVVPFALLPLGAAVAKRGWLGFARVRFSVRFLLLCPALLIPYALMHWVPGVHGLTLETVSAVLRFGAAYLIFVTGVLFVLSGAGSQPAAASQAALREL